ncbi:hypothetical protein Tco_0820354 [Tanacetum coccineum]|uniref:Reverse transcriptase domain-containing protein n=1 Tax=Tanacetum coccineum TaxID=301880 RepID=A0ABQ5A966_9ASTR
MSSPNHPTFDIEDAFSSNFPDYIPASPDYFPASPGNTSFESSNNSSGLVPIASPTLSLFHNDPYMKVMQSIFIELDNSLSIIQRPLGSEPVPEESNESDACLTALEALAASNEQVLVIPQEHGPTGNSCNKNGNYKRVHSCQHYYFNGPEGSFGLIRWKMEDEFYNLTIKGDDLKTYIKRFQELAVLCLNMVPNTEKLMEAFIGGLPRSIEENVTASKPQTLEEAINITQSFDVVIGMDWLSKYHARIICDEKVVHIPIDGKTLIIRAQVMEKKSDEKRLEDIPVVREFLEVFPEDLPGLPSVRQVEFQIDLIPGAASVDRAPYRLAPSEMQELSNQL